MTVYFIGNRSEGSVKIGYTGRSVNDRLKELQTGSHYPLTVLATMPGSPTTESNLHRRFGHKRLHGEWFRLDDEIERYIAGTALPGRTVGNWTFELAKVAGFFLVILVTALVVGSLANQVITNISDSIKNLPKVQLTPLPDWREALPTLAPAGQPIRHGTPVSRIQFPSGSYGTSYLVSGQRSVVLWAKAGQQMSVTTPARSDTSGLLTSPSGIDIEPGVQPETGDYLLTVVGHGMFFVNVDIR